ncbi:hypothetical protein BC938DRAFT_475810 [Jimgerdemannia flammicorona]|uniref:Uncharacterized protein n=1 Tax=Jimgerdemannia flammicorona TaxID=994334 RepID=A0A433PNF6_9FUNG|nr:hypothetical protein BC938DRAFT_475810 [Jimgerdemannia flammicorona]
MDKIYIDALEGGRISDFWKGVMHSAKLDDIEKNTALEIRMFQAQHHIAVANRMLVGNDSNAIQIQKNIVEESKQNDGMVEETKQDRRFNKRSLDDYYQTNISTSTKRLRDEEADKAKLLSNSSDADSDDNGSVSPCEAVVKAKKESVRKRLNCEPRNVQPKEILVSERNENDEEDSLESTTYVEATAEKLQNSRPDRRVARHSIFQSSRKRKQRRHYTRRGGGNVEDGEDDADHGNDEDEIANDDSNARPTTYVIRPY